MKLVKEGGESELPDVVPSPQPKRQKKKKKPGQASAAASQDPPAKKKSKKRFPAVKDDQPALLAGHLSLL